MTVLIYDSWRLSLELDQRLRQFGSIQIKCLQVCGMVFAKHFSGIIKNHVNGIYHLIFTFFWCKHNPYANIPKSPGIGTMALNKIFLQN